jgi:hypothetical protein
MCAYALHTSKNRLKQDRKRTYNFNTEARRRDRYCCEKVTNITHSDCESVALVIRHAKGMRHVILSVVASAVPPYFSTSSHKHKTCLFIFPTTFVRNTCTERRTGRRTKITKLKSLFAISRKLPDVRGVRGGAVG